MDTLKELLQKIQKHWLTTLVSLLFIAKGVINITLMILGNMDFSWIHIIDSSLTIFLVVIAFRVYLFYREKVEEAENLGDTVSEIKEELKELTKTKLSNIDSEVKLLKTIHKARLNYNGGSPEQDRTREEYKKFKKVYAESLGIRDDDNRVKKAAKEFYPKHVGKNIKT